MKKICIYTLLLAFAGLFFACEKQNMPDPVRVQYPEDQSPIVRDNAYYARLRAYKKTPHKLAFGWYGSWTAISSSKQNHMSSVPDSMDIISVWSQWHSLSKEQIADKAFVQQILGAKVVFCISAKDMPAEFKVDGQITEEGIVAYAKAWGKDSMDKYQYDGMDIDFETAVDHQGPMNTNPANFKKFAEELSKYIGPKSGTGRLFLIDGNIDSNWLPDNIAELCDYAVSQAYNCSGASNLDGRTASAGGMGWRPEQIIFTENFESLWSTGGVTYTTPDRQSMPSLLGMAHYAKTSTSAGFGSYHMEYEYGNSEMQYKYMRQAIQLANPAPQGDFSKNLVTLNEAGSQTFSLVKLPSGSLIGDKVETTVTAHSSGIVSSDTDLKLTVDNSLIGAYNEFYYTEYKPLDPALLTISGPLHFVGGTQVSETPVTVSLTDFSKIEQGEYLIPLCIDFSAAKGFAANTAKQVKYLIVKLENTAIIASIPGSDKLQTKEVFAFADGSLVGSVSQSFKAELTLPATEEVTATATVDPELVKAYNAEYGTEYAAVAAADISVSNGGVLTVAEGSSSSNTVTVSMSDLSKLSADKSLIAVKMTIPAGKTDFKVSEELGVLYIAVQKTPGGNLKPQQTLGDYTATCDQIVNTGNTLGWDFSVVDTDSGEPGYMGQSLNAAKMYDDDYAGWRTQFFSYYWSACQVTLDMKAAKSVKCFVWNTTNGNYGVKDITQVLVSIDGSSWIKQNKMDLSFENGATQGITFIEPVDARYIRLIITGGHQGWYADFGMKKVEIWTPKN